MTEEQRVPGHSAGSTSRPAHLLLPLGTSSLTSMLSPRPGHTEGKPAGRADGWAFYVRVAYTKDPSPVGVGFPRPLILKMQFPSRQKGSPLGAC